MLPVFLVPQIYILEIFQMPFYQIEKQTGQIISVQISKWRTSITFDTNKTNSERKSSLEGNLERVEKVQCMYLEKTCLLIPKSGGDGKCLGRVYGVPGTLLWLSRDSWRTAQVFLLTSWGVCCVSCIWIYKTMDNNNVENYNRKKNEDFKGKWRRDRDKKKSLVSKVQQIFRPSNQLFYYMLVHQEIVYGG